MRRALAVALVFAAVSPACRRVPRPPRPTASAPSASAAMRPPVPESSARPAPSAVAVPTEDAAPALATSPPRDAAFEALSTRPIARLERTSGAKGTARAATLDPPLEGAVVTAVPMTLVAPKAFTHLAALSAMARALELEVAPKAVVRPVGLDMLSLGFDAIDRRDLLPRLAVQNDGTVDVLLFALPTGGYVVSSSSSPEATRLAQAAASLAPLPGENAALLRAFVAARVLDYLAAAGARGSYLVDPERGLLVVTDDGGAFPLTTDPRVEDLGMKAVRSLARFPRGLLERLRAFDAARAREVLEPRPFEGWLATPRALVELDERRRALITLLEARARVRGPERVFSL